MPDRERLDVQLATIYRLRLKLTNGEKTDYTKEELLELIDNFAEEDD